VPQKIHGQYALGLSATTTINRKISVPWNAALGQGDSFFLCGALDHHRLASVCAG